MKCARLPYRHPRREKPTKKKSDLVAFCKTLGKLIDGHVAAKNGDFKKVGKVLGTLHASDLKRAGMTAQEVTEMREKADFVIAAERAQANGTNGVHRPNRLAPPSETVSNGEPAPLPMPPAPANPVETPATGRDAGGRFAPGNKFAAGNPFARRMANLRSAFLEAVTVGDLQAVAWKLMDMAKGGDLAAAKLLLAYTIGQPVNPVNPDRMDLDEMALLQELPTAIRAISYLFDKVSSAEAIRIIREMAPIFEKVTRDKLDPRLPQL